MQNFNEFKLKKEILDALEQVGYTKPTPIQEKSIKPILEGKDMIACAQTGTGKTAAFSLPILNDMERNGNIQALILTPTRELAIQIKENMSDYSKNLRLKTVVIYGGVKQGSQVRSLQQGADILIATPGRLLDLINQKYIDLRKISFFVLDEADNMLDMGFIHDIRKLIKIIPKQRQTLLFSATMPPEIKKLADTILTNPVEVSVAPVSSAVDTVKQTLYYVNKPNKSNLLIEIMQDKKYQSTLIFTRTKHGADKLTKILKNEKFKVAAIHGNKSQNNRQRTLAEFKDGKINTLIATDIAARGLDIDDLSFVINYEIPNVPETYIHRIGRTGRAGKSGESISLCDNEEIPFIKDIQKLMKKEIEVNDDHGYPLVAQKAQPKKKKPAKKAAPKTGRSGAREKKPALATDKDKKKKSNRFKPENKKTNNSFSKKKKDFSAKKNTSHRKKV